MAVLSWQAISEVQVSEMLKGCHDLTVLGHWSPLPVCCVVRMHRFIDKIYLNVYKLTLNGRIDRALMHKETNLLNIKVLTVICYSTCSNL